ncbi:MAG: right-handed parallel beta-helix repeat-containing protein [Candidatus Lokiarchaeota archaeon]|nr:right-handed parallel beta-helix repeat-containing protein [Candidatus Lokiarchaeota archaeon]
MRENRNMNAITFDYNLSDNWYIAGNIIINDTNPNFNWTYTNITYEWCNGAGSWDDPYIIENVSIDAGGSGSGIIILNSNVHFIIRNCSIYNTGINLQDAAIKLINVNNSKIIDNYFLDIDGHGIWLKDYCTNNTISDNDLLETGSSSYNYMRNGIYLYNHSNNNTIAGNYLYRVGYLSDQSGIQLENHCNFNKIKSNIIDRGRENGIFIVNDSISNQINNNTLFLNELHGIYFRNNCSYNNITNNQIYNNGGNGIFVEDNCDNYTIFNNTIDYNNIGIELGYTPCDNFLIYNNTFNENSEYGIHTYYSTNIQLWDNKFYNCGVVVQSDNITQYQSYSIPTSNTVNGKKVYYCLEQSNMNSSDFPDAGQIILIDSSDINLTDLDFTYCSTGIYIRNTRFKPDLPCYYILSNITLQGNIEGIHIGNINYVNISDIIAIGNQEGIYMEDCFDIKISNINLTGNINGISSWRNDHINFLNITAIRNYNGIELHYSHINNVINCTLNDNTNSGLWMSGCQGNSISDNQMRFNKGSQGSVYLSYGRNNNVFNNCISENAQYGIYVTNNIGHNYVFRNDISNNNKSGIYVGSYESDLHIVNNTISFNDGSGIEFRNYCNNNNITGNEIYNNSKNGIMTLQCNDIYVNGNRIHDNRESGIYISGSHDNYIYYNSIYENQQNGIYIYYNSYNNIVLGNFIIDNKQYGVFISESTSNTLEYNKFISCGLYVIGYYGHHGHYTSNQIDTTNTVNDKRLYYFVNQDGLDINAIMDPGQIFLYNCSNSNISNVNVSDCSIGIVLILSNNITIATTTSSNNKIHGIYLRDSYNCTLIGNIVNFNGQDGINLYSYSVEITGNIINYNSDDGIEANFGGYMNKHNIDKNEINHNGDNGIYILQSWRANITGNTIEYNNNDGILLFYTCEEFVISNNSLSYNYGNGFNSYDMGFDNYLLKNKIVSNQKNGIYLQFAFGYNITENEIHSNLQGGIFTYSWNCTIWNNSIIDNGINAIDNGTNNYWDNGSMGNYWDDYSGQDNNNDGIGDTPYYISGSALSQDNFPIYRIIPDNDDHVPDDYVPDNEDSVQDEDGDDDDSPGENLLENNTIIFIVSGIAIGSVFATAFGVYKGSVIKKSRSIKEPLLGTPKKDMYKFKSQDIEFYDETIKKNPLITQYLETDISIDHIPKGDQLIATILDKDEIRKINAVNLPTADKQRFIVEILGLDSKERSSILDELLKESNSLDVLGMEFVGISSIKNHKLKTTPKSFIETEEPKLDDIYKKQEFDNTESEIEVKKPEFFCLVHKGQVKGENVYLCPHCNAFYCKECVEVLRHRGEKCWLCNKPLN